MSKGENRTNGPQFRTAPLITSAAMVGGGTLIALAGLAVGGGYLMAAGATAWQNGTQNQSSPAIPANG